MGKLRITLALLFLCSPALSLGDTDFTSAQTIRDGARAFLNTFAHEQNELGRETTFEIGTLDARLRLAKCQQELDYEFTSDPLTRTANTLLVSCKGSRPWRLFLNAEIRIKAEAMVTQGPLSRGTRLQSHMLEKRSVVINEQRKSSYSSAKPLQGMLLRRSIGAGTLLSPDLLEAPDAVARGDRVIISARSGPVVIETRGKALASGKIGEQVLVENLRSQRRIYGIISAPGRVKVTM